jgi:hypothetical protein
MALGRMSVIHKGLAQSWVSGFFSGFTIGVGVSIFVFYGLKKSN